MVLGYRVGPIVRKMAAFFADQGAGRTPTALVPPTVLKHRNVPARAQAQCLFVNGCLLKKTSLLKLKNSAKNI